MTIEAGMPIFRRERHYKQQVVRCFANRPPTVAAMFRASVERAGNSIALKCETRSVTYKELDAAVEHTAAGFARLGLGKGDRIALLLGNNIEFVVTLLAAARLGAISVPMNIRQRRREILYMLNQSAAAAIVYDAILEPEVPEGADVEALRCFIRVGRGGRTGPLPFEDLLTPQPAPAAKVEEEDVLCLLYTSGTTGRPKGAMLTHLGIIHSVLHYRRAFGLDADDVAVLAVPASHVTGLVAIMLAMISDAGRTVIMPTFRAPDFLAMAARERMTYTLVVPAIYNLCLLQPDFRDYTLDAWRVGGFGGAPMPAADSESTPGRHRTRQGLVPRSGGSWPRPS
jgi:long-chain acyl-CoA synthetase